VDIMSSEPGRSNLVTCLGIFMEKGNKSDVRAFRDEKTG